MQILKGRKIDRERETEREKGKKAFTIGNSKN